MDHQLQSWQSFPRLMEKSIIEYFHYISWIFKQEHRKLYKIVQDYKQTPYIYPYFWVFILTPNIHLTLDSNYPLSNVNQQNIYDRQVFLFLWFYLLDSRLSKWSNHKEDICLFMARILDISEICFIIFAFFRNIFSQSNVGNNYQSLLELVLIWLFSP